MVCTGVTEIRQSPDATPFRLGGIDLIDLRSPPRPPVPLLLWTPRGLDMTHNPVWLEATPGRPARLLHARGRHVHDLCVRSRGSAAGDPGPESVLARAIRNRRARSAHRAASSA